MPMRKAAWIYLLCDIYSYSATRQVRAIGSVRKKSLESLGFAGVSSSSCGCAAVRDTTGSSARTRGRLPWCHLALSSDWCNSKLMGSFCLILKDIVSIFISLLCHTHRMKKNKSLTALGFLQTLFLLLSPARLWVQLSMDDCDPTSHTPWAAWQQHLQLRGSRRSQAAAGPVAGWTLSSLSWAVHMTSSGQKNNAPRRKLLGYMLTGSRTCPYCTTVLAFSMSEGKSMSPVGAITAAPFQPLPVLWRSSGQRLETNSMPAQQEPLRLVLFLACS